MSAGTSTISLALLAFVGVLLELHVPYVFFWLIRNECVHICSLASQYRLRLLILDCLLPVLRNASVRKCSFPSLCSFCLNVHCIIRLKDDDLATSIDLVSTSVFHYVFFSMIHSHTLISFHLFSQSISHSLIDLVEYPLRNLQ